MGFIDAHMKINFLYFFPLLPQNGLFRKYRSGHYVKNKNKNKRFCYVVVVPWSLL